MARQPDFNNLLKVLDRGKPDRPTLFEFFLNIPLYIKLTDNTIPTGDGPFEMLLNLPLIIEGFTRAGYDYATILATDFSFETKAFEQKKSRSLNDAGIIHSCGNLDLVFDDIIDVMKFDGKHSYEDKILPVEEAYDRYAGRIAILGGIDVDFVIRSEPADVTRRSRAMLERSEARGSYALGTGNSVPAYVPDDHYFAMTEAALEG